MRQTKKLMPIYLQTVYELWCREPYIIVIPEQKAKIGKYAAENSATNAHHLQQYSKSRHLITNKCWPQARNLARHMATHFLRLINCYMAYLSSVLVILLYSQKLSQHRSPHILVNMKPTHMCNSPKSKLVSIFVITNFLLKINIRKCKVFRILQSLKLVNVFPLSKR